VKLVALLVFIASVAAAQDSSYSTLRVRAGLVRNPMAGHIADDWSPGTGVRGDVATNLGKAELSLGFSHLGYAAKTGKPPYKATMFSLGATRPVFERARIAIAAGAQLTDYRMDFNDPLVGQGLKTEEEVMLSAVGRGVLQVRGPWRLFADASYGILMLGTKTHMVFLSAGAEYDARMPGWLRDFLR
jgi:hypothetical protein